PSNDTWNVKTNNVVISTLQVFNILGKQVMSLTPETTEVKIDASGLQTGMYIAKIGTTNGISNLRLVRK
ncbi:MAG: T9SS type A sorting domain-containing protein, partial [Flavobacteriaceae bacterium]|nr:T9SS type A sorting domain-containing protein [Flavobacteriaceae bacterium]